MKRENGMDSDKFKNANDGRLLDSAVEVALEAHKTQCRKGTHLPYITHPLAVGILLAKAGCADEVIAAGHDKPYNTLWEAEEQGFDPCERCVLR